MRTRLTKVERMAMPAVWRDTGRERSWVVKLGT